MRVLKRILTWLGWFRVDTGAPKYRIGNVKHHNSHIDTLVPQLVEIGDNFISAPDSMILAHDASLLVHTKKYRIQKTRIGDNVFLGAHAVILPGVTVGDGAIVGAGAVVSRDVPPYSVVAGNPAKVICSVDEYIRKCERKNCLCNAEELFERIFITNERPTTDGIRRFQQRCTKEVERRLP